MALTNYYKTLFDLRILHHYFLDEDNKKYEESGNSDEQERFDENRQKYDLSNFMIIRPTERTQKLLRGYKAHFQQYKDGFRVGLKALAPPPPPPEDTTPPPVAPFIAFDSNFYLDFTMEIKDKFFENYTRIEWDKNGLIYLSNLDPVAYTPGSEDEPPAVTVSFSRISQYETNAAGTTIDINLLKDATPSELRNKFGVIRLYLQGETGELQLVDSEAPDKMPYDTPEYNMYLDNRRAYWRFRDAKDPTSILYTTDNKRPLTENGYKKMPPSGGNNSQRYANPDAKNLFWEDGEYYAEAFVNKLDEN